MENKETWTELKPPEISHFCQNFRWFRKILIRMSEKHLIDHLIWLISPYCSNGQKLYPSLGVLPILIKSLNANMCRATVQWIKTTKQKVQRKKIKQFKYLFVFWSYFGMELVQKRCLGNKLLILSLWTHTKYKFTFAQLFYFHGIVMTKVITVPLTWLAGTLPDERWYGRQ